MSKKYHNKIVPKLRFSEFMNNGEWIIKSFEELFEIGNGRDYKHLSIGDIPMYGSGGYMLSVDDYLYDGESVCIGRKGTIDKPLFLDGKFWTVDTLFYTHSFNACTPKFIYNIFQNIKWLKHNEAGGVPSLSKTTIYKIKTAIPDVKEQQKIAACLLSLDNVIITETQRLKTLQLYKKGLLQNLFPAEGENVPKLRFKEFERSGEWEEKKFNNVCNFIRGPFGGALKKEIFISEGYAIYEQSHAIYGNFNTFRYFISEEKFNELQRFRVLPNDIIMSCSGTMGKFSIIPKKNKTGIINQALLKLTVNPEHDVTFIKTTLELPQTQNMLLSKSAGGAIKNIVEVSQIKEIRLLLPSLEEQLKIASCISEVDHLITIENSKIESLKLHKKGLLQGLFPNTTEIIT